MKFVRTFWVVFDTINNVSVIIAAILTGLMMLYVTFEVTMRTFFSRTTEWLMPVSELSMLYIVFSGTAWVLRRNEHIALDLVSNRLSPRNQSLLNAITCVVGAAVCLVILFYGIEVTVNYIGLRYWKTEILDIPSAPFVAIVPASFLLLSIEFMRKTYNYYRNWRAFSIEALESTPANEGLSQAAR